jgi:hypothetical protein
MNFSQSLSGTAVGAALGTSKAGIGIAGLGSFRPERIMKASHAIPKHLHANIQHHT